MFDISIDVLERRGVPRKAMLHVNLEEPGFSPELGLDLLDRLYDSYREEVFPEGRAYLFLDEVQQVPGWERWVRARNEDVGNLVLQVDHPLSEGVVYTMTLSGPGGVVDSKIAMVGTPLDIAGVGFLVGRGADGALTCADNLTVAVEL